MPIKPQLTADGFDTLYSAEYGQTYHSVHGAYTEALHVFLQASGVADRLSQGKATRILEVGFGAGLNFLLTAGASLAGSALLNYTALEKNLLSSEILGRLNHAQQLPEISRLYTALLKWREALSPNDSEPIFRFEKMIELRLILGDATTVDLPQTKYHAIYHDAFSPEANPALWTEDFFTRLYERLAPGGKLSTYSVKGAVRRSLQTVGFIVKKRPGPPGKREMLVAMRPPGS